MFPGGNQNLKTNHTYTLIYVQQIMNSNYISIFLDSMLVTGIMQVVPISNCPWKQEY